MNEKEKIILSELSIEQLFALDELLNLEEYDGADVTDMRANLWIAINVLLGETLWTMTGRKEQRSG